MKNIFTLIIFIVAAIGTSATPAYTGDASFSQDDRDRFIRFETKLDVGFQQIEKRFEQVDKRFEELRKDVNKRFEELRDGMNKRFEQIMTFLWMLTGIFTTLTIGVIGFAYWERKERNLAGEKPALR